jgi:hypothetical protein
MISGMCRRAAVLLVVGTVLLAAGCGGSRPASTAAPQVNSAICGAFRVAASTTAQSCTFVLDDGRRLGCNRSFAGTTPSVSQLVRDGCHWLTPLKLSSSMRALILRIGGARRCLTSRGLRAVGGPAFQSRPPDPAQPDGELLITSTTPSFIAFYTDAARARRTLPALQRADAGEHVLLERRGAVTIAWTHAPDDALRGLVWTCVSG